MPTKKLYNKQLLNEMDTKFQSKNSYAAPAMRVLTIERPVCQSVSAELAPYYDGGSLGDDNLS